MTKTKGVNLDTSLLIAFITMVGYVSAFMYKNAYLSYFGIPTSLVELDIVDILIVISTVFGIIWILISVLNIFLYLGLMDNKSAIGRAVNKLIIYSIFFLIYGFLYITNLKDLLLILSLIILIWFIAFLPLLRNRNKKIFEEKLKMQESNDEDFDKNNLFLKFKIFLGNDYYLLFLFSLIIIFLSYMSGGSNALKQKEFSVLTSNQNAVVVDFLNNKIIGVFINEDKKLTGEFFIREISSSEMGDFYLKNIDIIEKIK